MIFGSMLLAVAAAACAQAPVQPAATATAPAPPATLTTLPPPATATPISLTRQDPSDTKRANGSPAQCTLINIGDVATTFAAETNQPLYETNLTDHPIFSSERVATDESYCLFLAFHLSGSASGSTYQATYWVDTPHQAAVSDWEKAWTDAKAKATRAIAGFGEDAFYDNGRLSFKKGDRYLTIEVLNLKQIDTHTPDAIEQQINLEERLAKYALGRIN